MKINWIMFGLSVLILLVISIAMMIAVPGAGILIGLFMILGGAIGLAISAYYISVVNRYANIVEADGNVGGGSYKV